MENNFVLSATLELRDKMTAGIRSARSSLTGLEQGMNGTKAASDRAVSAVNKAGSAMGAMAAKADAAKRSLEGIKGTHSATIRANDNATSTVRRVKTELSELAGKVYTATVNVKTNKPGAKLNAGSAVAANEPEGIGSKLMNGASGVAGGMLMNTSMQMAGAAGIGFGIYDAIKGYMDFEKEMSAVKAISGASEADFQKLTEKAIQMGADTKFSAFESAQALEYMGMAGWKADEMMDGLPGIMNLAAASGENLASVSDIVTDSMSAFKLQASDAAMFSDVLAAAATNSNTNVGKLGYSFKYVAPVAGALGYTIQDVSIALGTMADAGIKAEQAGTSMRELLTRMAKPTKESADAMAELGLSFTDATGKVIPLRDQMNNMRSAFAGKSRADQARLAAMLAGQEGMSGLLAIVNQSQDKFDKLTDAIDNSQGAAERMSKTRLDNLAGDLEYLSGDWDTFTMKLMKGNTAGGLRSFVKEADNLLTHFADVVDKSGLGIQAFAETAGMAIKDLKNKFLEFDGIGSVLAGGALATGLYKIVGLSKKAIDGVRSMAPGGSGGKVGSLSSGASAAREMVVNASTVVVNGKSVAGGAGGTAGGKGGIILGPDGRPISSRMPGQPMPPKPSSIPWKEMGISSAVAAGIGALDVWATKSQNEQLLKEAAYGIDVATENLNNLKENGGSEESISAAEQQLQEMRQYQQDVQTSADIRMDEATGGAVGSVIGAGIGGALMGPLGMAIGAFLGEEIGRQAGDRFHVYASGTADDVKKTVEPERMEDSYDQSGLGEEPEMQIHLTAPDPQDIAQAVQDTEDGIATQSLTDLDDNSGYGLKILTMSPDDIQAQYQDVQEAVDSGNDAISDDCNQTAAEVVSTVDATGTEIETSAMDTEASSEGIWGVFAGSFDTDVAQPTAESAAESGTEIASSYADAEAQTEGAWSGTPGWFESAIWGPLKEGAASAARSMAASIAQAAQSAQSGGHSTIASGLNWAANQVSWLGGGQGYATGTTYFRPKAYASGGITSFAGAGVAHGLAQVNEHGGELIDLPNGSRIYPAATTEHIIQREVEKSGIIPAFPDFGKQDPAPASSPSVTLSVSGNTFVVREEADMDRIVYRIMQEIKNAACNHNSMEIGGAY